MSSTDPARKRETPTGFMLLDQETIKLLDTTYNEDKLCFLISHQQGLLVAVEWVNSIIHKNPRIHEKEWKKFMQLDAFVAKYTLKKQQGNINREVQ